MYIGYLIGVGKLEWVDCPGCGQTSLLFLPGTVPGMNALSIHAEGCQFRPGPHHELYEGQDDPPPVPGWDSEEDTPPSGSLQEREYDEHSEDVSEGNYDERSEEWEELEGAEAGYRRKTHADDLDYSDCPAGTDF
jgi:hypothetical protein